MAIAIILLLFAIFGSCVYGFIFAAAMIYAACERGEEIYFK